MIAHRGDSFHAPENTIEAARLGHEAGADGWEFDTRLTRDGAVVVLHDASLLRTTDVALRFAGDPRAASGFLVADFDLDEIGRLDAGGWFLEPQGGHRGASAFGTLDRLPADLRDRYASGAVRVPTLAEALEWTRSRDWLANVELKADLVDGPALVAAVLAEIDGAGATLDVLVSSFDHDLVATVVRERPEVATGLLTAHPLHRPERYAPRSSAPMPTTPRPRPSRRRTGGDCTARPCASCAGRAWRRSSTRSTTWAPGGSPIGWPGPASRASSRTTPRPSRPAGGRDENGSGDGASTPPPAADRPDQSMRRAHQMPQGMCCASGGWIARAAHSSAVQITRVAPYPLILQ